jgi:putative lipoprotein
MLLRIVVVAMLVAGCETTGQTVTTAQAQAPVYFPLVGTSWTAVDIDGRGTLDRVQSTVTLDASQRLSGNAACNRYFGTYELAEATLRLKPAGSTRMACEPAVMEQETRFLATLEAVTAFRREGTALLLLDAGGRVRMRLVPAPPSGRPTGQAPTGPPLLRAYAFNCADGPAFVLSHAEGSQPGEAIELVLPDGRRRLARVPTASGERYAGGGASLWSKGREATLELNGRTYACTENRRRSIIEDARRRGVDLRAVGQEPGWIFELFPDRMVFSGSYGTKSVMAPRPAPAASPTAGEIVYAAVTEAHRLTARVRETSCVDTMSGERYESTIEVELDGEIYRGCGETLH